MTSRSITAAVLGTALLAAACTDAEQQAGPTAPESSRSVALGAEPNSLKANTVRPEEAEFFELVTEISGFGGYVFDGRGNLVAHVKEPKDNDKAKARLEPKLKEYKAKAKALKNANGKVVILEGRYSFPELAAWRDLLTDSLLDVPGVIFTDADEAQNRVVVGVKGDVRTEVEHKIRTLGIPSEAVALEASGDGEQIGPALNREASTSNTLRSFDDPIMGWWRYNTSSTPTSTLAGAQTQARSFVTPSENRHEPNC